MPISDSDSIRGEFMKNFDLLHIREESPKRVKLFIDSSTKS